MYSDGVKCKYNGRNENGNSRWNILRKALVLSANISRKTRQGNRNKGKSCRWHWYGTEYRSKKGMDQQKVFQNRKNARHRQGRYA